MLKWNKIQKQHVRGSHYVCFGRRVKVDLGKLLQELIPKQGVKNDYIFAKLLGGERHSSRKKSIREGSEA